MNKLFKKFFPFLYENPKLFTAFEKLFSDITRSHYYLDYCQTFIGISHPCHNQMTRAQWHYISENLPQKELFSLDLGCGTSPFFHFFQERIKDGSMGIDQSQQALDYSSSKHPRVLYKKENLEFFNPTEKFDLIISIDGLYNLSNYSDLLESLYNHLNSDGKLILPWTLTQGSTDPRIILKQLDESFEQKDFHLDLQRRWQDTIKYLEGGNGIALKNEAPFLWKALYDEAKLNLKLSPQRFIFIATK